MPKILVIEDEEAIRRVLKKILTEQDAAYDVYVAANGIDGLHEIDRQQFDLENMQLFYLFRSLLTIFYLSKYIRRLK